MEYVVIGIMILAPVFYVLSLVYKRLSTKDDYTEPDQYNNW